MDKILRELNLGTLVDRFDAEKIEPDNVISASDSELTRLGVSTIGDRIRLRDLCSRAGERADLKVPSVSTSRNREDRLALFNPRRQGREPLEVIQNEERQLSQSRSHGLLTLFV